MGSSLPARPLLTFMVKRSLGVSIRGAPMSSLSRRPSVGDSMSNRPRVARRYSPEPGPVLVLDDRLILHENVGTPFEQAYLVAHEIGHAELGDDPNNEPALKIDAERPGRALADRHRPRGGL